jgi:hypothetical protein
MQVYWRTLFAGKPYQRLKGQRKEYFGENITSTRLNKAIAYVPSTGS